MEQTLEAPISGFLSTYGLTWSTTLNIIPAVSALLGLLLSAKAIATSMVGTNCDSKPAAAKAVCPGRMKAAFAWFFLVVLAEISMFAVASTVLHPLVTLPLLLLQGATAAIFHEEGIFRLLVFLAPGAWWTGQRCSIMNLKGATDDGEKDDIKPAMPLLVAQLLRTAANWAIVCG